MVIENPKCLLQDMPLMKELEGSLGLEKALVHYCAFGRDEYKPTHLWTNDFVLRAILAEFTCEKHCHVARQHKSTRGRASQYDVGVIPTLLAEEVADYVDATYLMKGVRFTCANVP